MLNELVGGETQSEPRAQRFKLPPPNFKAPRDSSTMREGGGTDIKVELRELPAPKPEEQYSEGINEERTESGVDGQIKLAAACPASPSFVPMGFTKAIKNELGRAVAKTIPDIEGSSMVGIQQTRREINEATAHGSPNRSQRLFDSLANQGVQAAEATMSQSTTRNLGVAIGKWDQFTKATMVKPILPLLPERRDAARPKMLLWSSDSGMNAYTREELEQMLHFMSIQGDQKLRMFQMNSLPKGVMTAGGLQGISRGETFDSVPWGEIEVDTAVMEVDGVRIQRLDRGTGEMIDTLDVEDYEMESENQAAVTNLAQDETVEQAFSQAESKLVEFVAGKEISKTFGGKEFRGRVEIGSEERDPVTRDVIMRMVYEDGDEEDLSIADIFDAYMYEPPVRQDLEAMVGRKIRKKFGNKWWTGVVEARLTSLEFEGFRIRYSDRTIEDITTQDTKELVERSHMWPR